MEAEDAPPGFWPWPGEPAALVDGVYLESAAPTRFFQTLDRYPPEWGRLSWRVQLNRLDGERAAAPRFRTFYSGVEWNLRGPDGRWFLSGWIRWNRPGVEPDPPRIALPVRIEDDAVLFAIAPEGEEPLFLRCRVDARDRRTIAASVAARDRDDPPSRPELIVLDDVL
jgi:hypothetical protein